MQKYIGITFLIFCIITGCSAQAQQKSAPTVPIVPSAQPTFTFTAPPISSVTTTVTPVPPTLAPTPGPQLCSPISGAPIAQLTQMVSNPYHPPAIGSDDPHKGIDIAVRAPGSQVAVAGQPVQAAFAGRVAGLIFDRFPFGNAIIIETPLDDFPPDWWSPAQIPTPAPTLSSHTALTCPAGPPLPLADPSHRSLYVLYAHLQQAPTLKIGDSVSCGQAIDTVGSSGNALNPHLHFETRVGPSGAVFSSMAHYDNSATADEMSSYCLWSISELFQLVDPNKVLQLKP